MQGQRAQLLFVIRVRKFSCGNPASSNEITRDESWSTILIREGHTMTTQSKQFT